MDVVAEWLVFAITYPFKVVFVARLLACSYEIVDEYLTQLLPRVKLVF